MILSKNNKKNDEINNCLVFISKVLTNYELFSSKINVEKILEIKKGKFGNFILVEEENITIFNIPNTENLNNFYEEMNNYIKNNKNKTKIFNNWDSYLEKDINVEKINRLNREKYKNDKKKMLELIEKLKNIKDKWINYLEIPSIKFVKNKTYKNKLDIFSNKYKIPNLIINIKEKYEKDLRKFLENINFIENIALEIKVFDKKKDLNLIIESFFNIYKKNCLPLENIIWVKNVKLIGNLISFLEKFQEFNRVDSNLFTEIKNTQKEIDKFIYHFTIDNILSSFIIFDFKIIPKEVEVGDKFFPIFCNDLDNNLIKLFHQKNIRYILFFWPILDYPFYEIVEAIEEIFNKNFYEWKKQINIYGFCSNVLPNVIKQISMENNWKYIQNFCIDPDDKLSEFAYNIGSHALYYFVDEKGIICSKGNCLDLSKFEIEKKIQLFITNKKIENTNNIKSKLLVKNENKNIDENNYKKLKEILFEIQNSFEKLSKKEKKNIIFNIELEKKIFFNENLSKNQTIYNSKNLEIKMSNRNYEKFSKLITKFLSICSQNCWDSCIINYWEDILIKNGENCSSCKINISCKRQYYCKWCNLWFCEKCGNNCKAFQGTKKFLHEHNLVWIEENNEMFSFFAEDFKFGKKLFFEKDVYNHEAKCNCCNQEIDNGIRWICLNCKPGPLQYEGFVNLCNNCMNIIQNNENHPTVKNEILNKLYNSEKHKDKKHSWLRVPFSYGYYKY